MLISDQEGLEIKGSNHKFHLFAIFLSFEDS